jgi:hypothetical protein
LLVVTAGCTITTTVKSVAPFNSPFNFDQRNYG